MLSVGIDVGGTNLKAGLVTQEGNLLRSVSKPLHWTDEKAFAAQLAAMAREVIGTHPLSALASVGIGIPGAVDSGTVLHTENIPMKNLPLAALFRETLNLPVVLANDADCAAAAEYLFGSGRGTRNFVTVTLGTGIGGGLILNGRLYQGMCCAGEVGCMRIDRGEDPGSWESYASATGLIRLAEIALNVHPDSLLRELPLNGKTIFDAADRGDPAALQAVSDYVRCLGIGLTNLADILMPEVIALGGGVSAAPEQLLLEPVRRYVDSHCYCRNVGKFPRICRAELGNDAGIVGAAMIGTLL